MLFIFVFYLMVTIFGQEIFAKLRKSSLCSDRKFICNVRYHAADVIKRCHRSDKNINQCICESIELLRTNLATGDFGENFVMPALEPLYIDEIKIQRENNFNEFVFRNLYVTGPSDFVLKNMA